MKILGVDPSSTSTGLAAVEGETLLWTELWTADKKKSKVTNLMEYFNWLTLVVGENPVDMAIVELCASHRNMNTVRALSRFEAASIIALKKANIVVLQARVSQARAFVFGDGHTDKEAVFHAVKKRYPDHQWRRWKSGGDDETDAFVLAKAGPNIAERV